MLLVSKGLDGISAKDPADFKVTFRPRFPAAVARCLRRAEERIRPNLKRCRMLHLIAGRTQQVDDHDTQSKCGQWQRQVCRQAANTDHRAEQKGPAPVSHQSRRPSRL